MGRKIQFGTLKVDFDKTSRQIIGFEGRKIGFEDNS